MPYESYEMVIGLEVHVQLMTKSKAFSADDTRFGASPNSHVSAITLGHPGTLPRMNKRQIEFAIRLGLALNSEISLYNAFDRKNYFYADLPKGYQITQDRSPICVGGELTIELAKGQQKTIRIHHIHMEEDAGKSMHEQDPSYSLVDLNRAGVPLLEVVTEPDLRSAEEVDAFMSSMRQLVEYLEICDGNMEEGSMRCDCNVSVRKKGATKLGERCEIKNLNSMRYAKKAIEYEFKRQIDVLEAGGSIKQQTLNFNPDTGVTSPLREKEEAHDYRYFPEPDLPPIQLTPAKIEEIKVALPALPWEVRKVLQSTYGLKAYEANLISADRMTYDYFKKMAGKSKAYRSIANLIINKILPHCSEQKLSIAEFPVAIPVLVEFIQLIEENKVSNTMAYQRLFPALIDQVDEHPEKLAQALNIIQVADTNFLDQLVDEAIAKYPEKYLAYQKGKKGLLGFFMGEVMKNSKGKADPKAANELLRKKLEKVD